MTLSDRPVFIVGAPRSGTTLLRSMLDSHPNICCPTWETALFDRLSPMINGDFAKGRGKEPNFCTLERAEVIDWMRRAAEDLIQLLVAGSGKPRWGEKTPSHVFHMALIHEVFPRAQFVHIIRSGWEVVRSLQSVPFSPQKIRWSTARWLESIRAGRSYGQRLPPAQYAEVRYEELLKEPEQVLRGLCDFLEEPFSPQMLEFNKPEHNSFGIEQQPLQRQSVNHHRELSLRERLVVRWMASPLLHELGY
jgi:hypothetical protein